MIDSYLEMLIKIGESRKKHAKKNKQYAVWLIDAEMFLGRNHYKEWFLTEEPSTFFSWAKLAYVFTDLEHPLANYSYVFIEI